MPKNPVKSKPDTIESASSARTEEVTIPVIEEQVNVTTRRVPSGRVRVTKTVNHHTETVQVPVTSEEVKVRHVPIDEPIDQVPEVRQEGDVTIIPVTEEVVVVTKQLRLKEEIHLERTEKTGMTSEEISVASEEVEITRLTDKEDTSE